MKDDDYEDDEDDDDDDDDEGNFGASNPWDVIFKIRDFDVLAYFWPVFCKILFLDPSNF